MDKRIEIHMEVKNAMVTALFILLKQKPLSEITIKELVKKAGVARASFYRNFKTKEDIVVYFLNTLLLQYKEKYAADLAHIARYDNVLRTFRYVFAYKDELKSLFQAKLGQMFLDAINEYIITSTNLQHEKQLYKYPFYSYAGALYNVIYYWITSDCKEIPEEITEAYFHSLHL
ncbi:MAG: TetR/AcrR family transcriptional regulator [Roseburia sp.]|nr:TetR/AcrR family transcriptional regulator [Anaeroplasma bactoclasticum]MCM1196709.1 TetR/AcrR family transcriptional regulator [Roseburia sp.]MCM1557731.1 TetR/AcrR family transcriptional regulator [Anaeroplasma bactoclasticum]